jgi:hypothetical protein
VLVHQLSWLSPDTLSSTPSTSSALKSPHNTEEDPDGPEQADGDIQMEYSCDWLYNSVIGAVTENYP